MLSRIRSGLQTIFRRSRWEREMNEELQFHIEHRAEGLARTGLPQAEALRQARLEFGGMEAYKERCREVRGAGWIDELARNLRYAGRSLKKRPGFTVVAVLSLALGIGANTAVFSLLKNLMLSPLPVRDPGGLHLVVRSTIHGSSYALSYAMFEKLRDNFPIFSGLFGWSWSPRDVSTGERTETVPVMFVTGTYFETLGVRPALGRLITAQDDRAGGGADVAVLSYRTWKRLFAGDPGTLTRTLKIDRDVYRIIGVTPPEFLGTGRVNPPDIYIPLNAAAQHFAPWIFRDGPGIAIMARLKPGVPPAAAQNALREGWPRFGPVKEKDDHGRPDDLLLEDGSQGLSGIRNQFSRAVLVLMGLVAVVLLIACANLATLLFVRGVGRAGEMSIRVALGASRAQLVRQWMTECLLLALVGGLSGLLAADWITSILLYFVPEADRAYLAFHADAKVLALTAALTMAAGLLFGLLPALRASKVNTDSAMRQYARSVTGRDRLSEWLLAGQLAACLVLVAGAILFARTLWNLNNAAMGFDKSVVYADPNFDRGRYPRDRIPAAMKQVMETISRSPHIASFSMGIPPMLYSATFSGWAVVPGYTYAPDEDNTVYFSSANPGYFQTLSIPIVAGRDFDEWDRVPLPSPSRVMIVNESFVRHYYNGRNPVGQSVTITNSAWPGIAPPREIVGVVKDSKRDSVREPQKDLSYFPVGAGGLPIVARAKAGVAPSVCEAEIRAAFAAVAKNVPVETGLLEDVIQKSLGRDKLVSELSAAFGFLGVLLAAIGLYGAMAHSVSSRTREIGIRLALGADPSAVKWMVLRRTLSITGLGVLVGLPTANVASRAIQSLLFGVSPTDPLTPSVSAALLATVGLLAGWWPAHRAARLDPTQALRDE
jgi:predicted permease